MATRRPDRRRLLAGVAVVGVVSLLLLVAWGARPSADPLAEVAAEQARVGTTYAFDGVVCLGSQVLASTVDAVEVEQAAGGTTSVVRPPSGSSITLGYPVDPDGGAPAQGLQIPAGEQDCTLRVLVTPDAQGRVEAGRLRVRLRYGPAGLLRRTASVTPRVVLDVTGTGPDPRPQRPSG